MPLSGGMRSAMEYHSKTAVMALRRELKDLLATPLEGFIVTADETDMFTWNVAIFGPPGTIYQGGYFKATMRFPAMYPFDPPTLKFSNSIWHPNVFKDGTICISILHPAGERFDSTGEPACERWNPTQSVRTILLSVISLLNEPNTSSPANVDASLMYKRWKDSAGKDDEYAVCVRRQVQKSRSEAQKDGVVVPQTVEEYCVKATASQKNIRESDCDAIEASELFGEYNDEDGNFEDTGSCEDGFSDS